VETIRVIMPILLCIVEMVLESISGKMDFMEFQGRLAEKLQEVGREITKQVLESLDRQLREERKKRIGWQVCRTGDSKEILTQFGLVRYERTYYWHKKNKQYKYLVDEAAGYTPHQRVDTQVKAKLVAGAANVSYRKSAEQTGVSCQTSISGQTVLKALREIGLSPTTKQKRKKVETLYIEADEDHVASQHGRRMEARLVYIHEGWVGRERRELINPLYLSSVDEDAEAFWERVWEEVDAGYDLERIKQLYIMGDGAAWIRGACNVFTGAQFVLDRFHLMKHVRRAVGGNKEQGQKLWGALRFGNRQKAQEIFGQLADEATEKSRKQAIAETWKYIDNQWEGIQKLYEQKEIKCSAEGHVSHVLSDRLSSRPMGWSLEGARHMAYVRVCQANGNSVAEEYVRQTRRKVLPILTIAKETVEKQRKHLQATREILDNVPVFKGAKSYLYEALRGLAGALA